MSWITQQSWDAACRNARGNIAKKQRNRALKQINDLHNQRHSYVCTRFIRIKLFKPFLDLGHYVATANRMILIHGKVYHGASLDIFVTKELANLCPKHLSLRAFKDCTI